MLNKKLLNKIILYLLIISFTLWLGSYVSRLLITYQLFEPVDLSLRKLFINIDLNPLFYAIYPLIVTNLVFYILFIIMLIFYLITTNLKLKENGWLLIILIIVFITLPFEFYLMVIDVKIINKIFEIPNINYNIILSLVKERIIILNNFSIVEVFSFFLIIYLFIFKPLQKKK